MKIGFLTYSDPLDRKSWSGIHYRLFKAIENRGFTVVPLGPMTYTKTQKRIMRAFGMLHSIIFYKKKYNPIHNSARAYFSASFFSKKIKQNNIEVIFAPVSAPEIALLKTDVKIIYLSDSSFNQIIEYYSYSFWTNLSSFSIKESNFIERKALQKSSYVIYPSQWAAEYATSYYKLDPNRISIIKFGANMDTPKTINYGKDYGDTIKFLFLGVDWVRKGGDIALETVEALKSKGYNVKLIVCGCIPPNVSDILEVIPFLDKNKPEDNKQLENLLYQSHFLFLPTRAECYGIVFCEASAYGLPIITTDTGGVTSIVENGINGYALPLKAPAEDYVKLIEGLIQSPDKIEAMTKSARAKYESELSWDVFGEKFEMLAKSC